MADHEIHLTVVGPGYEWDWSADAGLDAARAASALREYAAVIGASIVGAWPLENVRDQIARVGRDFPEFPEPELTDLTVGGEEPAPEPLVVTARYVGAPIPLISSTPTALTDEAGAGLTITTQENGNGQQGS